MKNLGDSIDKAVAIALRRHQVKVQPDTLAVNWEIFGRRLRELQDLNEAFKFATTVSTSVKVPGFSAQPITLRIGPDILVGFIEKGRIPRPIG
jgi:hypothetical protein